MRRTAKYTLVTMAFLLAAVATGRILQWYNARQTRQLQLSVFVASGSEQRLSCLMDGIHSCAVDDRVLLRMVQADGLDAGAFAERLDAERAGGSDGVLLLYPQDFLDLSAEEARSAVARGVRNCGMPVLCVGTDDVPVAHILNYAAGRGAAAAQALCADGEPQTVYLLAARDDEQGQRLAQEAADALDARGVASVRIHMLDEASGCSERDAVLDCSGAVAQTEIPDNVRFGAICTHMTDYSALADGRADVLVVPNEFQMGHRGVRELSRAVRRQTVDDTPADYLVLTPDNLLDGDWDALLFD